MPNMARLYGIRIMHVDVMNVAQLLGCTEKNCGIGASKNVSHKKLRLLE